MAQKRAYRTPFRKQRCLLRADGYFEWYGEHNGSKQPFFIAPAGGEVLAMAGLYEFWRDPTGQEGDPNAWFATCTIITTDAVDGLGHIHDRMPMFVEPQCYRRWLDPALADIAVLRSLLVPAEPGRLTAVPVSKDVGNVRNDGAHLIEPLLPHL